MTLPTLLANQREKETVTRLKKAYSVMSQALVFAVNEKGTPDNWEIGDYSNTQGAHNIIDTFSPYIKKVEKCTNSSCATVSEYTYLNGNKYAGHERSYAGIKLADGTFIFALAGSNDCTTASGTSEELKHVCAFLYVDTNGKRKPNQLGKDFFEFLLTKNTIIPSGSRFASPERFDNQCLGVNATGLACTAWVIYNENLDYLKCSDLNWDTKTKCK